MAVYGNYQTVGTLYTLGLTTVWTARHREAEPDDLEQFVVKVFHPVDIGGGEVAEREALEAFLDAARVQANVAAQPDAHWAPIRESGTADGEAYYVTDYFPHSALDLMRVSLDARALHAVIESVVKGLLELRESAGRPHGNLKPSNVLIRSGEDVAKTRVVLTDPMPTTELELGTAATSDIRAVGALIYQLVLRRSPDALGDRVVQPSEEWRALGRTGEGWRNLCSRLLMSPDEVSLDALAREVEALRAKPMPWRHVAAALGALVVAAAVALALYLRPPPEPELGEWRELCKEYDEWFAAFYRDLNQQRYATWATDPDLKRIVDLVRAADRQKVPLDPRDILDDWHHTCVELRDDPPPEAAGEEVRRLTLNSLSLVRAVKETLSVGGWQKLARLDELQKRWDERGWGAPARYLRSVVLKVKPRTGLASAVDDVLEVHDGRLLRSIEARWESIQRCQRRFQQSGDPVLAAFAAWVRKETSSQRAGGSRDDLEALDNALAKAEQLGEKLAAVLDDAGNGLVDLERFRSEAAVVKDFTGAATEHILGTRWLNEVADYYVVRPDPRGSRDDWERSLRSLVQGIADLRDAGADGRKWAEKFAARLEGLEAEGKALFHLPPIRRDVPTILEKLRNLTAQRDRLNEQITTALTLFTENPAQWFSRVSAFSYQPADGPINAEWLKRRAALLPSREAVIGLSREDYRLLKRKVRTVQDFFSRLDEDLPARLPEEAGRFAARAWFTTLRDFLANRRLDTQRKALAAVAWDGGLPEAEAPEFMARWQKMRKDYEQLRKRLTEVAGRIAALEDAVDAGYQLDETPPHLRQPLRQAFAGLQADPLVASTRGLKRALEPLAQRLERLATTAALTERKALVSAALSAKELGVALAAWRALGRLTDPPWPSAPSEWESEKKILERIRSDVRSIASPERRVALLGELDKEGATREAAWLSRRLAALRKALEAADDEVLARFGALADTQLAAVPAGDTPARLARLRALSSLAARLARVATGDWSRKVARERFEAEGSAYRALRAGQKVSSELLEAWLEEVEDYRYLAEDDPSRLRHARLLARAKGAASALKALRDDDPKAANQLEQRLSALLANLPAPVKKNEEALPKALDTAEGELTAIGRRLGIYSEVARLEGQVEEAASAAERAADRDPIVAALPGWLRGQVEKARGAEVELRKSLLADLAKWSSGLKDFLAGAWASPRLVRDTFAREGEAYAHFKSTGKLSRELLEAWQKEAVGYFRIVPDPRPPADHWKKRQAALEALIAQAEKFGTQRTEEFRETLARLVGAEVPKLNAIAALEKNRSAIQKALASVKGGLDDLEARMRREIEPPSQWLARVAKTQPAFSHDAIEALWRDRRDTMLKSYPAKKLEADSALYLSARNGVERSVGFLTRLDKALSNDLARPPADWPKPLADRAAKARNEAIGAVVKGIEWGREGFVATTLEQFRGSQAYREAVSGYAGALKVLDAFRAALAQAMRMVAEGYLPEQKSPRGETIVSTLARLDRQRELVASFQKELGPARRLIAISRLDRSALVNLANQPQPADPRQTPLVVWKRLGALEDWPSGLAELKTEARLRGRVAQAAKAFAQAGHGDVVRWVEPELKTEGLRRWQRAFNAIALEKAKDKATALAEAVALAPDFGLTDLHKARLAPPVKLRYLVFDLERGVLRLGRDATKTDVKKLVEAFARAVGALSGGLASRAEVEALVDELRQAVAAAEEKGGAGLEKAGPATHAAGGGWEVKAAKDGSVVTYTWSQTGQTLRFVRVEPTEPADARPAYLCTSELTVGLFVGVVSASERWAEAADLLGVERLAAFDARKGPRAWRVERGGGRIGPARRWLVPIPGVEPYPEGAAPPRPARGHPMQYVSPQAAMFVARLLGCRLPTSWEWAAALGRFGRAAAGGNLRDRRWLAQRDHVAAQWAKGLRASWPDADIFLPPAIQGVKRRREATAVAGGDDGHLWFAKVGSGEAMEHLVGNVAELVFDAPEALETSPATAEALGALVEKHKGKLGVVGGSALSPPEVWNGGDKPYGRVWPVDLARAREGYSDVGFRLAFTAPKVGPAQRVARVLRKHDYLPGLD